MSETMQAEPFEFVQGVEYRGPEYLLAVTWRDGGGPRRSIWQPWSSATRSCGRCVS